MPAPPSCAVLVLLAGKGRHGDGDHHARSRTRVARLFPGHGLWIRISKVRILPRQPYHNILRSCGLRGHMLWTGRRSTIPDRALNRLTSCSGQAKNRENRLPASGSGDRRFESFLASQHHKLWGLTGFRPPDDVVLRVTDGISKEARRCEVRLTLPQLVRLTLLARRGLRLILGAF
jgi:hypothetical protein